MVYRLSASTQEKCPSQKEVSVAHLKRCENGAATVKMRSMRQLYKALHAERHPYFALVRFSAKAPRRLCDFTGLPAPYTCPRTDLRFCDLSVFRYMRSLPVEQTTQYFELRAFGAIHKL